jgi:hypothetical protein
MRGQPARSQWGVADSSWLHTTWEARISIICSTVSRAMSHANRRTLKHDSKPPAKVRVHHAAVFVRARLARHDAAIPPQALRPALLLPAKRPRSRSALPTQSKPRPRQWPATPHQTPTRPKRHAKCSQRSAQNAKSPRLQRAPRRRAPHRMCPQRSPHLPQQTPSPQRRQPLCKRPPKNEPVLLAASAHVQESPCF